MNQVVQIQFEDKMMSFDTFLSAIRNVVQEELGKAVGKRPFVSQAKAFNTYGRRNVERWVKWDMSRNTGNTTRKASPPDATSVSQSWMLVPTRFRTS